ncbi:MAG: hypothetical protein QW291_05820 [Thermofilaceae archaeon]
MLLKPIGWRHFELSVPSGWDIVAEGVSGNVEFFRVADSANVRLEITLERISFEKAKSLNEMLSAYQKMWEERLKELRKKHMEVEIKHVHKEEIKVASHNGLLWTFRVAGSPMKAVLWYCEKNERAISLTFTPYRVEEDEQLLERILEGVKCHYTSLSEHALWSLLLFNVYIPQEYRLVSAKFTTLSSYCIFSKERTEEYVIIGYSGLASMLTDKFKKGAIGWFEKNIVKDFKKITKVDFPKIKYEEIEDKTFKIKGSTFHILKSMKKIFLGNLWYDKNLDRFIGLAVYSKFNREKDITNLLNNLLEQLKTL